MAKNIQILIMIFCLGIFIFPKQNFFYTSEKSDCCKTEKKCCDKSEKKTCHKEQKGKKSCEGNCSNCQSCSTTVVLSFENKNILKLENNPANITKKVENIYLQPYISSLFISIWQPPKIG